MPPCDRADDQQRIQRERGTVAGGRIRASRGTFDIDHARLDRAIYESDRVHYTCFWHNTMDDLPGTAWRVLDNCTLPPELTFSRRIGTMLMVGARNGTPADL